MSIELTLLIWSAVLAFLHLGVQSALLRMDYGVQYANSQRDDDPPPPSKWHARGEKALRNFLETYAVFVALAVATELSGRSDTLTQWGATSGSGRASLIFPPISSTSDSCARASGPYRCSA